LNDTTEHDPRLFAIPDTHGHAKGEHKPYAEERPLPLTARMLFLWFFHACRRGYPRFLMVADHMNYLTFEDPAAVNLVRRALKLAQAGDLYGAAETANVDVAHAAVVSEGLRRGMRFSIGAEVDNDPRSRPDAQNIVDAMRPDAIIRSVHFVPITHPVHGENWNWPFDNPEFAELFEVVGTDQLWESYVTILVDAIERLPGHIIGHFYVPALFGHWPDDAKLSGYEDRVLAAAGARGMAIEFNTRFLYRDHPDEEKDRYLRANRRLLKKAKERGVQIAIGSDAHSPRDQGNGFEIVLQILDSLDINELVFPMGGSLRRVALRVVREPEPEPVPEPAPVATAPEAPKTKPPRAAAERPSAKRPKPVSSTNGAAAATPAAAAKPARPAVAAAKPARPAVAAAKTTLAAKPSAAAPSPATAAAKGAAKPATAASKPAAPAKAATKAAPVKKAAPVAPKKSAKPVAKPKPPARKPDRKATPVKAPAKKAAPVKKAAKKAPPAKKAPKKAAPAKRAPVRVKPAAKKVAPKRTATARGAAKKPARVASARNAPVRKVAAAKKSVKKTPAKRR
jgi:HisJ family histidinol phosphate phosphatase